MAARAPTAFEPIDAMVSRRKVSLEAPMESPIDHMRMGEAARGLQCGLRHALRDGAAARRWVANRLPRAAWRCNRGIDNDWCTRPRQHLPANHLALRSAFGAWRGARRSCRYGCDWRRGGRERRARRGPAPSACVVVVRVAILLVEEAVRIGGKCRVAIVPLRGRPQSEDRCAIVESVGCKATRHHV